MSSEILKFYNLKDNPFKLDVILKTFVGYESERNQVLNAINNNEKIILILGPTGAGKTTLLLWMNNNLDNKNRKYLYRPPNSTKELADIVYKEFFSFIEKIFYFRKEPMKILNKKKIIFLIDEATFLSDEMIEWIKVLADQTKAIFVLAALPEFEERVLKNHRTFYERIITKVYLKSLDPKSGKELIRKRLELAGNPNLFTDEAIDAIYKLTGGFPREMLKMAYECLIIGYKEGKNIIDEEVVKKVYEYKKPPEITVKLTDKQKIIVEYIVKYGPKSANELLELLKEKYEDMTIHALSNLLKRMVEAGYLIRNKVKNKYIYDVVPAIKNVFIRESFK